VTVDQAVGDQCLQMAADRDLRYPRALGELGYRGSAIVQLRNHLSTRLAQEIDQRGVLGGSHSNYSTEMLTNCSAAKPLRRVFRGMDPRSAASPP
jgi:hypothetical protein